MSIWSRCAVGSVLLGSLSCLPAVEMQPWQSLAGDTVAALNVPATPAYQQAVSQTRLGQLMSPEHILQQVLAVTAEHNPEAHQAVMEGLAEVGLQAEDLLTVFQSQLGASLQVWQSASLSEPDFQVFIWLNPGEELGARLLQALDRALTQQDGPEERRVRRLDHALNDQVVIELRGPAIQSSEVINDDGVVELRDMPVSGEQPSMLITESGGRFAIGFQRDSDQSAAYQERLVAFHRRWLQGEEAAFGQQVRASNYLSQMLPSGLTAYEVYADVGKLLAMIPEEEAQFGPTAQQVIQALGVDRLGLMGLVSTMEGNLSSAGFALESARPHRGIMGMLDQAPVTVQVPDWVPDDVVDAQVLSLDFSKVFAQARDMAVQLVGDEAEEGFTQADVGASMFLGADLTTIFAALGDMHYLIKYPVSEEEMADAIPALDPDGGPGWQEEDMWTPDMRFAWVQSVRNPQVITQMVSAMANMVGMWGQEVQLAEEQGFSGWRLQQGPLHIGMFSGQGQLIIAFDETALNHTLSLLNAPPPAASRLNQSPAYQRVAESLPDTVAAQSFAYQNVAQTMREAMPYFDMAFEMMEMEHGGDEGMALMVAMFKAILPDSEDFSAAFGQSATHLFVNDGGLGLHMVFDLPAAK